MSNNTLGIVFLVGFMGCGKSTKAKQLAQRLECPVVDLDQVIVERAGQPIAEFFAANGEPAFRELERDVLHSFPYPPACIVATGGGLPCYFDNMEWMNTHGTTVYLEMQPGQLVSRLQNREKRPLIKDLTDAELLTFIEGKLEERNAFYKKSQLIVDAFNLDAAQLEQKILSYRQEANF